MSLSLNSSWLSEKGNPDKFLLCHCVVLHILEAALFGHLGQVFWETQWYIYTFVLSLSLSLYVGINLKLCVYDVHSFP